MPTCFSQSFAPHFTALPLKLYDGYSRFGFTSTVTSDPSGQAVSFINFWGGAYL